MGTPISGAPDVETKLAKLAGLGTSQHDRVAAVPFRPRLGGLGRCPHTIQVTTKSQWPWAMTQEPIYWRYLPYVRPMGQAMVKGIYSPNMAQIWSRSSRILEIGHSHWNSSETVLVTHGDPHSILETSNRLKELKELELREPALKFWSLICIHGNIWKKSWGEYLRPKNMYSPIFFLNIRKLKISKYLHEWNWNRSQNIRDLKCIGTTEFKLFSLWGGGPRLRPDCVQDVRCRI